MPSLPGSYCRNFGFRGECGDTAELAPPITAVRSAVPVRLDIGADAGAAEIRGDIWRGERIDSPPIETFTLPGRGGTYVSRDMKAGRYYLVIHVRWSLPLNSGGQAHAFRIDIRSPS